MAGGTLVSSIYYVPGYIIEAVIDHLVKIFEVLGVERWWDKVMCIGVIGMALVLAMVVALVIPNRGDKTV